ncbi:MAG: hypothetical protein GC160_06885 [Acidobacteria bacterium]|nr:hypothetical protein [Acidobacteriota bacterium]
MAAKKAKTKAKSKAVNPLRRDVEKNVLDNGIRVITERVEGAAGVSLSVWVNAGSRYEELTESGMTYLIQQMAFHGTEKHSAAEIAKAIDAVGGKVETETGRDYAAYFAQVEADKLSAAFDLLAELTLKPKLTSTALSAESKIVLEELRAAEKEADFVLDRMFYRSFWKGHGLCRPPKGRLLTSKGQTKLENFKPKSIQRFHQRSHHPKAISIVAAGDLEHEEFLKLAEERFGALEEPKKRVSTTTPANFKFMALRNRPQFTQIRFRIGVPACSASDPDRHAAGLLNAILGAEAGSRLANLVREEELPVTEAGAELAMFADAGCLSVHARASRKSVQAAVEKVVQELRRLVTTLVPDEELERAKATRKASMMGVVDSLRTRVEDLARTERYFGKLLSLEDEIAAMEAVKATQLRALAANWIAPHYLSLGLLGNLKGVNINPNMLQW